MNLCGLRLFADVIRLRGSQQERPKSSMAVPFWGEKSHVETDPLGEGPVMMEADWRAAAVSRGALSIRGHHQQLQEMRQESTQGLL